MQPRRPRRQELAALLVDAVNERTFVTIDGRRRRITKREAIVTQMVDKSASADLRATKMLIDMMKDAEQKAGVASPPAEPRRLECGGSAGGAAARGAVAAGDPAGTRGR